MQLPRDNFKRPPRVTTAAFVIATTDPVHFGPSREAQFLIMADVPTIRIGYVPGRCPA